MFSKKIVLWRNLHATISQWRQLFIQDLSQSHHKINQLILNLWERTFQTYVLPQNTLKSTYFLSGLVEIDQPLNHQHFYSFDLTSYFTFGYFPFRSRFQKWMYVHIKKLPPTLEKYKSSMLRIYIPCYRINLKHSIKNKYLKILKCKP